MTDFTDGRGSQVWPNFEQWFHESGLEWHTREVHRKTWHAAEAAFLTYGDDFKARCEGAIVNFCANNKEFSNIAREHQREFGYALAEVIKQTKYEGDNL